MRGRRKGDRSRERKPRRPSGTKKGPKYLEGVKTIDYKDHELLRKFMTERGKIMPRRTTGISAKQQRQIKSAIRRARVMGLLP